MSVEPGGPTSDAASPDTIGCLTVIGDLIEDVVVWRRGPIQEGTDNPARIHRTRGGSAANVAALAAGASVPVRFIGRVGDDHVGDALIASLTATGVDVRVERAGQSGTVVVLVDDTGERTMFPDRATAAELARIPDPWLQGTSVAHVPAYGLLAEPMAGTLVAALERVRALGGRCTLDLSAASLLESFGVRRFRSLLDQLAPEVVFANADEARVLGLAEMRPWGVFVIKDGPRPARLGQVDSTDPTSPVRWQEVPAIPVAEVRDTTGAGDAFAAGYLRATISGSDPVEACRAGHARAASVLSTPGALG